MKIIIRNETPNDYREVENLTRESFWNVYAPGCDEHYFAHKMRSHPDFVPELAFVLELDGRIIGSILYTKSWLTDGDGNGKTVLSFGPVCIHPAYQRKGYGKRLLQHSFEAAAKLGYDAIVIFGNPGNYVTSGFKSCRRYNVCLAQDVYPTALLVKELTEGALGGKTWFFRESTAASCCEDIEAVAAFDAAFPPKEKAWLPSQEEFYIYSHSSIVR